MKEIMLVYGGFPFSLPTVPYQALVRQSGWSWPEQQMAGAAPVMQFTGPTAEKIELTGSLVPGFTGGRPHLEALRQLGNLGKPLPLVSGVGLFLGMWVMENLEEGQSTFFADGQPRQMSFKLSLKKESSEIQIIQRAARAVASTVRGLFS